MADELLSNTELDELLQRYDREISINTWMMNMAPRNGAWSEDGRSKAYDMLKPNRVNVEVKPVDLDYIVENVRNPEVEKRMVDELLVTCSLEQDADFTMALSNELSQTDLTNVSPPMGAERQSPSAPPRIRIELRITPFSIPARRPSTLQPSSLQPSTSRAHTPPRKRYESRIIRKFRTIRVENVDFKDIPCGYVNVHLRLQKPPSKISLRAPWFLETFARILDYCRAWQNVTQNDWVYLEIKALSLPKTILLSFAPGIPLTAKLVFTQMKKNFNFPKACSGVLIFSLTVFRAPLSNVYWR